MRDGRDIPPRDGAERLAVATATGFAGTDPDDADIKSGLTQVLHQGPISPDQIYQVDVIGDSEDQPPEQ